MKTNRPLVNVSANLLGLDKCGNKNGGATPTNKGNSFSGVLDKFNDTDSDKKESSERLIAFIGGMKST